MTLIIYCHPETDGHCSEILKNVLKYHEGNKLEYELIDLYKINYDPVLKKEEHYTSGNREISPQNREFQEKIEKNEKLIFIYPVWWGSMPAVLKGFLDRVLTARWAYSFTPKGIPIRLLKGRKAIVFQTLGGPKIFYKAIMNPPKSMIKMITLELCGIKTKVRQFFKCYKVDEKREKEIKNKVKKDLMNFYN